MEKRAQQLKNVPRNPGVYLFKNTQGTVLYVGKAKSLRPRVRSYFRPKAELEPAKHRMIPKIADIETISCDNETEALVLEASLIRKHQPPYNVILRDDKFYLFIKITTGEQFPRVFPVRRINKDRARYFGPYSSAASVRNTLKLLRRIFPHRTEKESPREKIFPHPLFSQPGNSDFTARSIHRPSRHGSSRRREAESELPPEQYRANIENIIRFLQGHRHGIIHTLKDGMKQAAAAQHYERAGIFRDQLRAIERLEGNQKVLLPRKESFDVISVARNQSRSAANVFSVRQGKLLNKNTFLLKHRETVPAQDILRQFMLQYYRIAQDIPRTILMPNNLEDHASIAQWINSETPPALLVPQRGKKKQLLTMGELNAKQLLDQEDAVFENAAKSKEATRELAQVLGLQLGSSTGDPLKRIETYDISNIQGALATGSMVVFVDGQPQKSQYRKFRIKAKGPDDFKMLQEMLSRRFSHLRQGYGGQAGKDTWKIPDLILIDGGKGQLSAAKKILDAKKLRLPIAAVAKREEELFIPSQSAAIRLPYDSPALYLIQRMRDEAHRFTISYHRLLRSKKQQQSILDEVPGIGPKTKKRLLRHFGSLKAVRAAPTEELAKIIGPANAKTLRDYL